MPVTLVGLRPTLTAELTAGQRVYEGALAGLTPDESLSRCRALRNRHAQLEKAVEVFKGEIKRNGHWLMPPSGRHITLVEGP